MNSKRVAVCITILGWFLFAIGLITILYNVFNGTESFGLFEFILFFLLASVGLFLTTVIKAGEKARQNMLKDKQKNENIKETNGKIETVSGLSDYDNNDDNTLYEKNVTAIVNAYKLKKKYEDLEVKLDKTDDDDYDKTLKLSEQQQKIIDKMEKTFFYQFYSDIDETTPDEIKKMQEKVFTKEWYGIIKNRFMKTDTDYQKYISDFEKIDFDHIDFDELKYSDASIAKAMMDAGIF